jgi:hypothetical protein
MVAAQPGSGRRASLYTDYTSPSHNRGPVRSGRHPHRRGAAELVTFAKAYSGLTQDEIESLDRWIRANTTSKNGPFRAVKPEQVFELAFEGVQASTRHKAGLAVRFPRINRWRTDKPAAEIDTLATLRAMIARADHGDRSRSAAGTGRQQRRNRERRRPAQPTHRATTRSWTAGSPRTAGTPSPSSATPGARTTRAARASSTPPPATARPSPQ